MLMMEPVNKDDRSILVCVQQPSDDDSSAQVHVLIGVVALNNAMNWDALDAAVRRVFKVVRLSLVDSN